MSDRLIQRQVSFTPGLREALTDFADYSGLDIRELLRLHHTEQQHIVDTVQVETIASIQVAARDVFGDMLQGRKSEHVSVGLLEHAVEHYEFHGDRLGLEGGYLGRWAILNGVALEMHEESYEPAKFPL